MKQRGGQPTHGKSETREYRVWADMMQRCSNPKNARYADYGGRGIKVCKRWKEGFAFANFLKDMGPRPSTQHSIDRINNDGNYEPSNCQWATRSQQQNNKRGYPVDNELPKGDDHWTRKNPQLAVEVARKNITKAHKRGEGNGRARLTEEAVRKIKSAVAAGASDNSLALTFGVRPGTIWFIRTGRNWSHVQ